MKLSKILKVKRQVNRRRIQTLVFLSSGILSLIIVLITFYGQSAGNFVMSVDYDAYKRGIVLSKDNNYENAEPRLMTRPVDEATDMNYSWLKINEVELATGNYIDPDFDYIAYTFYLHNNGTEFIDLGYHIRITDVYKNMDSAIRILVIEDGVQSVYKKADYVSQGGIPLSEVYGINESINFLTDSIVTRRRISQFGPNSVKKFSVIIWIEGTDPDTTDDILGGMVKFQMSFSIDTE